MFETTPLENHIENLTNMAKEISVSYSLGFKERGEPTIGIRRYAKDEMNADCIICDGIVYLIAGDAFDISDGQHSLIERVKIMHEMPIENIRVNLRAQATIMGQIVTVHLGTRTVKGKEIISDERGILHLTN
jgi:hypothetical protein